MKNEIGAAGKASAAVATPHAEAAEAGREMFLRGGNAIDAGVASMLAVCVAIPSAVGIGGYGGSMVIYLAKEKRVVAIDFDSRAPLGYREELYVDPKAAESGYLSVTVPGVLAGMEMAQRKYGALAWNDVCQHAAKVAEEGVVIDQELRQHLEKWARRTDEVSFRAMIPEGRLPEIGERWVQADLGRLIRRVGKEGAAALYHGEIPRAIVRQVQGHGGILSEQDMSDYRPKIVDPIKIDYRGYEVYTPPPPSGGITSLQILKTLEVFEVGRMKPWGAEYFHHFAEASKLCWQERARTAGDPEFVTMPMEEMLSEASARRKAERIARGGIVGGAEGLPPGSPHTANVCAADGEGNVLSLTATHGWLFGSGVVIEGLGLVMGHGMSRFDFVPGHPNSPKVGKRMHHNMSPTIVLKEGRPALAVGLPGGPKIISVTAQLVMSVIDFGASAEEAVEAPRVHTEGDEPVAVSSKVGDGVMEELRAMGHKVRRGQDVGGLPMEIGGRANAIVLKEGKISAASGKGEEAVAVV
jgi:gamma-glutamyltranspeptidase/glutathione hydrolase